MPEAITGTIHAGIVDKKNIDVNSGGILEKITRIIFARNPERIPEAISGAIFGRMLEETLQR